MGEAKPSGGWAAEALGFAFAHYLKLVRRLNRFVVEPSDLEISGIRHHPAIIAMWHGQHLMMPFAVPPNIGRVFAMVSRHRDAAAQAAALPYFKIDPVRGSGARGDKVTEKGGAKALIALKRLMEGGATVAMTADVPKVARVAGLGIVTLARITGRPILPIAVATSRRFDFKTWDRASLGLPFGRGAIVFGAPIFVPGDAKPDALETARLAVQDGLDAAHARALRARRRLRSGRWPETGVSDPASLAAYRAATFAATPFAGALLTLRLNRGKEDPDRLGERKGIAERSRPPGPLVWLHGASVGETLSLTPLVERLTQMGFNALMTSGTVTSARLMARRLPSRALHQFAPLDAPGFFRRFFRHWRPDLGLVAESEIWPNMIVEASAAGVPLAMVNARMSERSFRRWSRIPNFAAALLGRFELALAQSQDDADRLARLGVRGSRAVGNLKYDSPAPPADRRELAELSGLVSGRRLWLAASTHTGEERACAEAHLRLAADFPDLLTILAPRHPERGEDIAAELADLGLSSRRRSLGQRPERDCAVYVCDTIGELGLFYRLADVAFVGKSLFGGGGQNPIEPAKLACAILHGPNVGNFADLYAALDAAGGARETPDAEALAAALAGLLRDAARLRGMARAAAELVEKRGGAVERALAALAPLLPAPSP